MTYNDKELNDSAKETNYFCPIVIKRLSSGEKEGTTILEEVLEILEDFRELITNELLMTYLPCTICNTKKTWFHDVVYLIFPHYRMSPTENEIL